MNNPRLIDYIRFYGFWRFVLGTTKNKIGYFFGISRISRMLKK